MSSKRLGIGLILGLSLAVSACGPKGPAKDGAATEATKAEEAKGAAWLAKNAKQPGVHVLPSGLQYKIVQSGPADGLRPKLGDDVKVNYAGTLTDGTPFDSSYDRGMPAVFTLGEVVPGWNEVLQLMRPGDVWYVYLPAKLGYGDMGSPPAIPGGATLVFKVELIGVLPSGGGGSANG